MERLVLVAVVGLVVEDDDLLLLRRGRGRTRLTIALGVSLNGSSVRLPLSSSRVFFAMPWISLASLSWNAW